MPLLRPARACCRPPCPDRLDPNYLGKMVMVGMNKDNFAPPINCIKERYYSKFRSGAGTADDLEEE